MISKIKIAFISFKNWLSSKLYHGYYIVYGWFSSDVSYQYNLAMEVLAKNKDPKAFTVEVRPYPLTLKIIAHEIASNNTIEAFCLNLQGYWLDNASIKIIADFLSSKPNLTKVELCNGSLDDKNNFESTLRMLFGAIENLNLLKKLRFNINHLFKNKKLEPDFFDFFKTSKVEEIDFRDTGLKQNDAKLLFDALKENKNVAKVHLGILEYMRQYEENINENLTDYDTTSALMSFISTSKALQELSFFSDEDSFVKSVQNFVESSNTIKSVKVGKTSFYGLSLTADKLSAHDLSDKLDLSNTHVSIPALGVILQFAKDKEINKLYLNKCNLNIEHAKILANFIEENPNLEQISLNENNIGNDGAKVLLKAIATSTSLQKFCIREINADNLFNLMADSLMSHKSSRIKSIDCSRSERGVFRGNVSRPGPDAIDFSQGFVDMLKNYESLVELNLGSSGIDTAGLQKLADFLQNNKVLEKLDLSLSNLSVTNTNEHGMKQLFNVLQNNTSLLELVMRSSHVESSTVENIAGALKLNCTLRKLDLGKLENFSLDRDAEVVVRAMLENPASKIQQLNFDLDSDDKRRFEPICKEQNQKQRGVLVFFAFCNLKKWDDRWIEKKKCPLPTLPVELVKELDEMLDRPRLLMIS